MFERDVIVKMNPVQSQPSAKKVVYLPGLNGIRAIAALSVVISHITLELGSFGLDNRIFGTNAGGNATGFPLAGYGVSIFFTLSGFLITYLLLKEKAIGPVKIKAFYIRRMLRIWPLYYLYFFVAIVTILVYGISFDSSAVPFYIFLAANIPFILGNSLPLLAHYWSLGVEEQFYLFFPHLATLSNKKLLVLVLSLIVGLLFLKLFFYILATRYDIGLPYLAITVTRFQNMLIGVAGAILYYSSNRLFLSVTTHKLSQVITWTCFFLVAFNQFHVLSFINEELVSLISLFLIVGQIKKRNNLLNLEHRVCDFIGKISYGIYVIHPILIFYLAKVLGRFTDPGIGSYILVYTLVTGSTMVVAYLSFELYEKRFLKLKANYSTVKSSNIKGHS